MLLEGSSGPTWAPGELGKDEGVPWLQRLSPRVHWEADSNGGAVQSRVATTTSVSPRSMISVVPAVPATTYRISTPVMPNLVKAQSLPTTPLQLQVSQISQVSSAGNSPRFFVQGSSPTVYRSLTPTGTPAAPSPPVVFNLDSRQEIHSVVVLLGLSFFGFVWGLTGMFLSVPLLFAMHAWLDTIAKRDSYGQEACEDARFIMGILEGRWLATVDEDPHQPGTVNLLTGHIEEEEPWAEREEHEGAMGHSASQEAAPVASWKCTERCKECLELRDPQTGEVLVLGLLLRWILMAGTYTFVFFGFWIFHWDLHFLIHPSGGQMFNATSHVNVVPVVPLSTAVPHAEVSTTIAMTMAQVMTMAPHFPFRPEGEDLHPSDEGAPSVDPLEHRPEGAAAPDLGPRASESPPSPGSSSGLKHRKNAVAGNTSSPRHGGGAGPAHLDGESTDEDRSTSQKEEPEQNLET
ncbi:unnamed protein product [Cladocopium goreaui]|uniref:Transmembrane protein n=1 Tax=Cladocopium goreaui TaxID=2562237 RepID=A0A9P1DJ00_9DINO|nr:unnamed protein product [Cladocopium goreaui]